MIESVNVSKTMQVPAKRVWTAIAGIGGLDRWFPVIAACRVIGSGVGAMRILTLAAGGEIKDRIELIDHQRRCFQYNRIESPFPVSHYLGTVTVNEASDGGSEISWTVEIDVPEAQRDELLVFIRQALAGGIVGLEQELQASEETISAEGVV